MSKGWIYLGAVLIVGSSQSGTMLHTLEALKFLPYCLVMSWWCQRKSLICSKDLIWIERFKSRCFFENRSDYLCPGVDSWPSCTCHCHHLPVRLLTHPRTLLFWQFFFKVTLNKIRRRKTLQESVARFHPEKVCLSTYLFIFFSLHFKQLCLRRDIKGIYLKYCS